MWLNCFLLWWATSYCCFVVMSFLITKPKWSMDIKPTICHRCAAINKLVRSLFSGHVVYRATTSDCTEPLKRTTLTTAKFSVQCMAYETLRLAPDIVLSVLAYQKVTCSRCNHTAPLKHLDAHIDSKCVSYFNQRNLDQRPRFNH